MSRYSDTFQLPRTGRRPALPPVSWTRVGQSAPTDVPVDYRGPAAPLPKADAVVMTWTTEEWSALDHVFIDSETTRAPENEDFQRGWYLYSNNVGSYTTDGYGDLWGYYRLVDIASATGKSTRVLLYKSAAHLGHPPWLAGLKQMAEQILTDTGANVIYSIGTAGGSREAFRLGDVVITNAAQLSLKEPENVSSGLSGKTFSSKQAPPSGGTLLGKVQKQLYFKLDTVVTYAVLNRILQELQTRDGALQGVTLDDLLNAPLRPENLAAPATRTPGVPLLTTDYYYIAPKQETKWAALEMDDAVVADAAASANVQFVSVRNISDTLVPNTTQAGKQIDEGSRDKWSGRLYDEFGLYTSCNGALATWALLAG